MDKIQLQKRTKQFAIRIIKFVQSLEKNTANNALASQIIRSGTSVAANYRAACRAKSYKDFLNKIKIVEEEVDESALWLELFIEAGLVEESKLNSLHREAIELTAIFTATLKTARKKLEEKG